MYPAVIESIIIEAIEKAKNMHILQENIKSLECVVWVFSAYLKRKF